MRMCHPAVFLVSPGIYFPRPARIKGDQMTLTRSILDEPINSIIQLLLSNEALILQVTSNTGEENDHQ